MMYRFLWILLLLLSTGCATPRFPEGIPTAMIRFTANVPVAVGLPCEKDRFIKGGMIKNEWWREISPVKMYGTRSDKNNEVIERLIPADRTLPFRVMFAHGTVSGSTIRTSRCVLVFSFRPQPHEQYQADYVLGTDSCNLKMYRLSEKNGAIQKTEMPIKLYPDPEKKADFCRNET
jgi:hypothetical protein